MPSQMMTASLQSATLSTLSNVLAQFVMCYREGHVFTLDLAQLARFVAFAILHAPPNYKFQQLLERSFPAYPPSTAAAPGASQHDLESQEKKARLSEERHPGANRVRRLYWRNTMAKWFIDCITLGAFVNTMAFLTLMGLMKGQSFEQIAHNLRAETITIVLAGYKIWPIASIISFTCVPVEKRIVWLSFVGLLWGVYMSFVAARV